MGIKNQSKKTTDTDKLVQHLADDLPPVKQLSSAGHCVVCWWTGSVFIMTLAIGILGGIRPDISSIIKQPAFIFENIGLLLSGLLSCYIALYLRIPRPTIPGRIKYLLAAASAIWVSEMLFYGICTSSISVSQAARQACLYSVELAFMVLLPLAFLFILLRRGAPTWPFYAGYAATLAAASLGEIGMHLLCVENDTSYLLLWLLLALPYLAVISWLSLSLLQWGKN